MANSLLIAISTTSLLLHIHNVIIEIIFKYLHHSKLMLPYMNKLLLFILIPINVFCQNTIGLPDVINYTKQSYNAGLQNWHIKQDDNGIIYVANNEGLLTFDGKNWNLHALPNKTIVRSVEIGLDNKIYVGGQDEVGYFSPEKNGVLGYHSLTQLIPAKDRTFGDVWDIVSFNKNIFFRSTYKIFKLTNNVIESFNANSEWSYLSVCNGKLYAHDFDTGLMLFSNDTWSRLPITNILPVDDAVTSILPLQHDSAIIVTLKHGLFFLSKTQLTPFTSSNNDLFKNERIYAATKINKDWLALATTNSGVYIIDLKGNIIQSFSRAEGVQNKNVLSIFLDKQSNLWLGLDNGIDLITYNSAIKQIDPLFQNGSGYASIIYNNQLYIGTTNELFSVSLQPLTDLSFSKGTFKAINNTKGQVWNLSEVNNKLLMGKHEGAFLIQNNSAQLISTIPGFWNFVPLSGTFPSAKIIAGNYKGIAIINYLNNQFTPSREVINLYESSRYLAIDNEEQIWVSHPYHGVFKIHKNEGGTYVHEVYTDKNGLPAPLNNLIFKLKNEVVVATEKGIYVYNKLKDQFEISPYYQKFLGTQSIRYLKEDMAGNIWFIHEKTLGVIDLTSKNTSVIVFPELNNKLLSGFEYIYPFNENNIFVGGEKGLFHINYEKYKKSMTDLAVQIRIVRITNQSDSVLFGGYFTEINEKQLQTEDKIYSINNNWKTIHFEFSSSLFGYQSNLEYSYLLKGFDDKWSSWTKRTEMEYTNLAAGKYTFEVKVRNNLGKESATNEYVFTILPPWYKSIWAILLYAILLATGIYKFRKYQRKKFKLQREKYEKEQEKLSYIHELELNKTASEMVALRNEKLEVEVNFKNSELASSAMHLVKKGEVFSKIKADLTKVMKELNNPQSEGELKKMIKSLGEDDNLDKEWEKFTKHFDKVHSDFLSELKDRHPSISPSELKLCAYLRMNLSTKEIAGLMNISVRGVDIGRYRLRKKLLIPSEKSLFDYMISVQPKV